MAMVHVFFIHIYIAISINDKHYLFSAYSVLTLQRACWAHMIIDTYVRQMVYVAWSRTRCKSDTIPSKVNVGTGMRDDHRDSSVTG